ncbi:hypothetical protein JCM14722_17260 [Pseudodesulfovibrio portus]|uniref:Uncharacterized protein n=1 Tax=Pseudodesulfovibrio portus TaxID=231439 RepID=A0ABM8ARW7_9BACT|nr:hypothetical protein JCM14722_17260 [Pseudodesulfovibrio portus]
MNTKNAANNHFRMPTSPNYELERYIAYIQLNVNRGGMSGWSVAAVDGAEKVFSTASAFQRARA